MPFFWDSTQKKQVFFSRESQVEASADPGGQSAIATRDGVFAAEKIWSNYSDLTQPKNPKR